MLWAARRRASLLVMAVLVAGVLCCGPPDAQGPSDGSSVGTGGVVVTVDWPEADADRVPAAAQSVAVSAMGAVQDPESGGRVPTAISTPSMRYWAAGCGEGRTWPPLALFDH